MTHHGHHHSDKGAAYTGLVVSVVAILAVVFAIVTMTNAKFEGHAKGGAAATQSSGH
jgi:hypothetical protein